MYRTLLMAKKETKDSELLVKVTTNMKLTTTINIPVVFIFRIFLRIDK
jgi:hypothetical protein